MRLHVAREPGQVIQRFGNQGHGGQARTRIGQDRAIAIQLHQRGQARCHSWWRCRSGTGQGLRIFGRQRRVHSRQLTRSQPGLGKQGMDDAGIGKVDRAAHHIRRCQRVQGECENFQVRLEAGVAINLCAELQRLAAGLRAGRQGVQDRAAITQAGDTLAVEQVGVNARHLRGAVGAYTERAARELVHQFEGLQIQPLVAATEQRLQVLHEGWHHQLVAVATGHVEQLAPDVFDMPRLRGQHIGNVVRQDPS